MAASMDAVLQLGTAVMVSTTMEESADFCDKCCRIFRVSFGCIFSIIAVLVSAADIVTDWKNFLNIHNSDFRWSEYAQKNDYEAMLWALCGACVVGSLSTFIEAVIVLIRLCLFCDIIGRDRRHNAERVARRELIITYIGEVAFHVELFCQDIVVIILFIFATFRHLCPYFMASGVISIGITLLSSCIRILKIIIFIVLANQIKTRRPRPRKTSRPQVHSVGTLERVSERGHIVKSRSVSSQDNLDKVSYSSSYDGLENGYRQLKSAMHREASVESKSAMSQGSADSKDSFRKPALKLQKSVSFDDLDDQESTVSSYSSRPSAKYDYTADEMLFLGDTYKSKSDNCCGLSPLRRCQVFVYIPLLVFLIVILLLALYYFPQQQATCEELSGVKMKPIKSSDNFISNLLFR